jgi:hypothetical protein
MLRIKQNIAERTNGLKFRISVSDIEIDGERQPQPFVDWIGEATCSADEMLDKRSRQRGRPDDQRGRAKDFIKAYLSFGSRPADEVVEKAKAIGISKSTLERAKDELAVQSRRSADGWDWQSPPNGE